MINGQGYLRIPVMFVPSKVYSRMLFLAPSYDIQKIVCSDIPESIRCSDKARASALKGRSSDKARASALTDEAKEIDRH